MQAAADSCSPNTPWVKTFIPATEPLGFSRVSQGVSEGFFKGPRTFVSRRSLQNVFKNRSKTLQEGVEIDDALGFPGA